MTKGPKDPKKPSKFPREKPLTPCLMAPVARLRSLGQTPLLRRLPILPRFRTRKCLRKCNDLGELAFKGQEQTVR